MAEELNVGRIVAEIVLEAETKKAEEQIKSSAETIQSNIQNIANHSAETVANAENKTFTAQQKSILKFYEQNKKLYQENQQELVKAINNIADRINMPKQALDDLKEYLGLSKQITEIPTVTVKETPTSQMYENIRTQLENLGMKANDVNKIMENCFSDLTGYKKYQQQLDILSAKLEIQRQKVEEVRQAKDNAVNGTSAVSQEKSVKAYETENLKLKQLEYQYQNTKVSQENYVNQKISQSKSNRYFRYCHSKRNLKPTKTSKSDGKK